MSGCFCWTLDVWDLAILSPGWMNSDHSVFSCIVNARFNFSERDLLLGIVIEAVRHHGYSPLGMEDAFSQLWRVLSIESPGWQPLWRWLATESYTLPNWSGPHTVTDLGLSLHSNLVQYWSTIRAPGLRVASAEASIETVAAQLLPRPNPASFSFLLKVFPTQPSACQSHSWS